MLTKAIFSIALLALVGLGVSSCSTSDQHGSGGNMTMNPPPAGGGY
ncbi:MULTISPECIES: hypothetical protein [Rhizobium]|jgi:hypothetical protein|uniref:Lipoprotein n=1 Tax=Rhizobium lusitanum TaxID=293958 RepID=A0A1C3W5H4_9HYPH|nr:MULTISPECIES: hypothetical protein [Rhizobium]NRP84199.1 hypothetical protein [Ensifer adhaerens]NKJ04951.1 hypothetical protein [Rhizobium sp. SG741]NKJ36248.1 hypothetical protein [Rhizobium sp. SG570]NTJ05693.1 hypothetical protein [Rhizobium lusitanum]SCB35352.1 hypothetical protein GA0061101_108225 [Rhizobium lusitanum]